MKANSILASGATHFNHLQRKCCLCNFVLETITDNDETNRKGENESKQIKKMNN